jgi:hypothetical protein
LLLLLLLLGGRLGLLHCAVNVHCLLAALLDPSLKCLELRAVLQGAVNSCQQCEACPKYLTSPGSKYKDCSYCAACADICPKEAYSGCKECTHCSKCAWCLFE